MHKLTPADLLSLEAYAERRAGMREQVIGHKRNRTVHVGENMTILFEDRLTVRYQVQEMLRIERIFERAGILEELAAYNPLIPDGDNWKATCLIEIPDVDERRRRLAELHQVEHRIWAQVGQGARVFAIADEDLDRSNDEKTSAVHFLRFQLPAAVLALATGGAPITVGVDHDRYRHQSTVPEATRKSLAADLD